MYSNIISVITCELELSSEFYAIEKPVFCEWQTTNDKRFERCVII